MPCSSRFRFVLSHENCIHSSGKSLQTKHCHCYGNINDLIHNLIADGLVIAVGNDVPVMDVR